MKRSFTQLRRVWLLCALVLLGCGTVSAQVSTNYNFSQGSATYTPITGGTRVGYSNVDDAVYGALPIGFNFTYNGTVYTQFGLNGNGWISLGSSTPSSSSTPISGGSTNNVISALGNDLVGGLKVTVTRSTGSNELTAVSDIYAFAVGDTVVPSTGYLAAGTYVTAIDTANNKVIVSNNSTATGSSGTLEIRNGDIRYQVLGSSPNQVLVVQFSNFRRYDQTNVEYNFQIKLYEGSNRVEIQYGGFRHLAANTNSNTYEVGIRGASTSDYNNRRSTTSWASTTAGTSSSSTVTTSTSILPASGLQFIWNLATCFIPTNLVTSAATSNGATLTWNKPTQGTPTSYQWIVVAGGGTTSSTQLASGITANGNDTSVVVNTLNSASAYTVFVRSICGVGDTSGYTAGTNFTTSCPVISTFPWTEGFETIITGNDMASPPVCWGREQITNATWNTRTTVLRGQSAHGGNNSMYGRFNSEAWLYTPAFSLTAGQKYEFSFYHASTDVTSPGFDIHVRVGTSATAAGMTTQLGSLINVTSTTYNQFVAYFIPTVTGTYYFGVKDSSTSTTPWYYLVDDFAVNLIPTCTAAVAGTTSASVNPGCANQPITLSITGGGNEDGITYQWISSTDGINYSPINAANSASLTTTYTGPTYYRNIVSCSFSSTTDTSTALYVPANTFENCYCIPSATDCTDGDVIDSVAFAGIINASGCSTDGYELYTTPVGSAMKTQTYPITVRVQDGGTEYVSVWIDYDHSGTFDTSEYKFIGSGNDVTLTNTITIPANALTGVTRMRIRDRFTAQLNNDQACFDGFTYGETEDYLLNIVDLPACTNPPTAGTVSGDTSVCAGNTTQLTVNGFTLGTQLQWQRSTDNSTWANVAGATSATFTSDTITNTVYYRVKVTCLDSVYTAVTTIVLAQSYECYCSGFTQDCTDGDVIRRVQFGNIDNTTDYNCANGGYTLFTSPVDTFYIGSIESMTVTVGDGGTENVSVWIDYNQNGVFDTTEYTFLGTANDDDITNNINIPGNALTGLTVMRIRDRFSSVLANDQACYNGHTYGETEDYLIYLSPPPPCVAPVVAGTINGPSTSQIDSTETYVLTGYNGNIQWQYSNTDPTGPYVNFQGSNNDSIDIIFLGSDTFYLRAYLTFIGCDPDSTTPFQIIVGKRTGDDVCDAIQLNFGSNGPFSTGGATIQPGEVAPYDTTCSTLSGWCDGQIDATMWFKFTAPASGRVRIYSPHTTGDSQLALWDAPSCDSLLSATGAIQVAANDDDPDDDAHGTPLYSAYIDSAICLTPGKIYWVQLDAYDIGDPVETTIELVDLGAGPVAAFTNLDSTYCTNATPITLTPAGGTFTGAGVTGNVFSPAAAGVGGPYVISRNYYACYTYSDTVYAINGAPSLTVDDTTDVLCNGGNTGAVAITVTGGTTPYAFAWTGGSTSEDLAGATAGNYSVTVTDVNACSATGAATITEPTALFLGLDSSVQVACPGGNNGAVYVAVSGGVTPYTYAWSNSATTEDITGLTAGQYTLTVTDANNCTIVSNTVNISAPAPISIIVISTTNVNCNGGSNGGVNITVTGGNAPYTYLWSNGVTTQDITNVPAGTYTPTITDNKGCQLIGQTFTITEPAVLAVTVDSTTNASCSGNADGAAYITVSGGTTPYSYSWSNSSGLEDQVGILTGTYQVTIQDSHQCSVTTQVTVGVNVAMAVAVDSTSDAVCAGGSTGDVYISVTGGTTPYGYTWSNSTTNEDLANVPAGAYSVVVNDASGCSITATATVGDGYQLNAVVDSTHNVSCNGGNDGAVYITPTNGSAPYTYGWSNSASTQDITGLAAGTYTLTLSDANGCTYNGLSASVTAPTAIVLTSVVTDQVGATSNGAINVTVSGGTSPYTSAWSNSAATEDLTAISAGIYTTTVTDANGCTATKTDTVDLITGIDVVNGSYTVAMYPNPTAATANVEVKLENANDVTVEVYNVAGQLVESAKEYGVSNAKFGFDFTKHAAGVYNTKITIGDKVITKRLVVNK